MMQLTKKEWTLVAVMAGAVVCFGGWLQAELKRAATARTERVTLDAVDPHAFCAGMSARESAMMDNGKMWCGSVDAAHVVTTRAEPLNKS